MNLMKQNTVPGCVNSAWKRPHPWEATSSNNSMGDIHSYSNLKFMISEMSRNPEVRRRSGKDFDSGRLPGSMELVDNKPRATHKQTHDVRWVETLVCPQQVDCL